MITTITTTTRRPIVRQVQQQVQQQVQPPTTTVEEVVKKENEDKWSYEEGIIKIVLPLNDRVEVAVEPIFHPNDDYDSIMSVFPKAMLYNTQFQPRYAEKTKGIPLLQCFVPLVNFDASTGQELKTLVNRHVRVKIWNKSYVSEAELIAFSQYENPYKTSISVEDMFLAEKYGLEAGPYLRSLGHPQEKIDKYLDLTLEEVLPEGVTEGVLRLDGEAFWDKDVLELTEQDIKPRKWSELIRDNAKAKKNQLCHMPIIMFTGK